MHIPNKKEFLKELEGIKNDKVKSDLIKVYNHLIGKEKVDNVKNLINDIFKELFKSEFSEEINIPYRFLNTLIAKVLFTVMFYSELEKTYSVNEVAGLLGCSRQYVWQIKDKLNGYKEGGRLKFKESDIKAYMAKKQ